MPNIHTVRVSLKTTFSKAERPQRRHGLFYRRNLIVFDPLNEIKRSLEDSRKRKETERQQPALLRFYSLFGITYAEAVYIVNILRIPFDETRHLNESHKKKT